MRLPEMDRAGVDVQVLSLTSPGIQMQPDTAIAIADAHRANDHLLAVISDHPDRFAGLAAVALQDPEAAAAKLRRTVSLGLRGALVNDHTLGHYFDEPQYEVFWNALEELDVPLYIHPSAAPPAGLSVVNGHPELVGPTWSWGVFAGGHAMRLIYAGVFDRHPRAKLILGHMGEFLPFQLSRFDIRHQDLDLEFQLKRLPSEYFGRNILATTTGVLSHSALIALIQAIGIDAVMFSSTTHTSPAWPRPISCAPPHSPRPTSPESRTSMQNAFSSSRALTVRLTLTHTSTAGSSTSTAAAPRSDHTRSHP